MKVTRPIAITLPTWGVYFAESEHAQNFEMPARADPYHKIVYVLRGRVRYQESKGAPETAATGSLLLVPSGIRHAFVDEVPSTLLLLCVAEAFLRREPDLADLWRVVTHRAGRALEVAAPEQALLEAGWRRALLEQRHLRPASAAATCALALQFFVQVARLPPARISATSASRVAAVVRTIEETFFEAWTLDRAADQAGMSRRHFTAHFRRLTGHSFWQHLTDVRLRHAAKLLEGREHSVAGVIFACGFGDVSQFYRLFRARFGRPPKAWADKRVG